MRLPKFSRKHYQFKFFQLYYLQTFECSRMKVRPLFGHMLKWNIRIEVFFIRCFISKRSWLFGSLQNVAEKRSHSHSCTFTFTWNIASQSEKTKCSFVHITVYLHFLRLFFVWWHLRCRFYTSEKMNYYVKSSLYKQNFFMGISKREISPFHTCIPNFSSVRNFSTEKLEINSWKNKNETITKRTKFGTKITRSKMPGSFWSSRNSKCRAAV